MKLTGGPWGTFDQAEACLAPMTTVRMLASRATAERLATRRVDSILKKLQGRMEDSIEGKEELALKTGEGREREETGEEKKVGDAAVRSWSCLGLDSCDSGIGYLLVSVGKHNQGGTWYIGCRRELRVRGIGSFLRTIQDRRTLSRIFARGVLLTL